jgi:mannose-6-phosphate isomerase-like protein (cupin superfamily)
MVTQAPHRSKVLMAGEGEQFQMLSHAVTMKISGDDTNGEWAVFEATDTFGNGAPLHTHPWDETFYVLDGKLEIQMGEETIVAPRGAVTHIPANTVHGFRITSDIAQVLVMISPGYGEAFYREVGEMGATLPPDMQALEAIAKKHGVQLFLP